MKYFSLIAIPTKYTVTRAVNKSVEWLLAHDCVPVVSSVLRQVIDERMIDRVMIKDTDAEAIKHSDVVVSIGGDGTLLHCSRLVLHQKKPILGINSGRLGFLANIQESHLDLAFQNTLDGKFGLDKRNMLKAEDRAGTVHYALNEFLFSKSGTASLITLSVWYDNEFVNKYWSDGLIIASPTGSTAYNMSCGGPIIAPGTRVIVLTPINPHTLTTRPLVISTEKPVRIETDTSENEVLFSKDGEICDISSDMMEVTISRSEFTIDLIKLDGHNYFETLRTKLMWGRDLRDPFPLHPHT